MIAYLLAVGMHLLDVHSTELAITNGGIEQNPRVAEMLEKGGIGLFAAYKVGLLLILGAAGVITTLEMGAVGRIFFAVVNALQTAIVAPVVVGNYAIAGVV